MITFRYPLMWLRRLPKSLFYLLMLVLPLQVVAAGMDASSCTAHVEQVMSQQSVNGHDHGHASEPAGSTEHEPDANAGDGAYAGCPICTSNCHTSGALSSLSPRIPLVPEASIDTVTYQSLNGYIADTPRRPPRNVTL